MKQVEILKPWGHEVLWAKTDNYAGKLIRIAPGKRLSLQYHIEKSETIYVLSGILQLDLKLKDEITSIFLIGGDSYHIPPNTVHRFCCPSGPYDVQLMEVSTTQLDDVVRIEDDFGRV